MKKKIGLVAVIVFFIAYFFLAAREIPRQMVLVPRWISSLESGETLLMDQASGTETDTLLPFSMGSRFGFVRRDDGRFSINRTTKSNVSLSGKHWAEYEAEPNRITIYDNTGETYAVIDNPRGYPFFLDEGRGQGRIFIVGSEQNSISEIDTSGAVLWTYEFAAQITCVDAARGLLLAGSLDGLIVVIDSSGRKVFSFEPGGSRYPVILGCALSRDGSALAIISGIDNQRFLFLEQFGAGFGDYKVVYHEFLIGGFRRPVFINFVENDRWVVFERTGGLGFYEAGARHTTKVGLDGEIGAVDQSGGQGLIFAIVSKTENRKELAGILLPDRVMIAAPFKSGDIFLDRSDSRLLVGGGQAIISFELERK
ncbi:MAG: WD40 repeat domain-containing protein [Treponema sp.]|nr:WD40 repeat domain-containing protein [Treponema sp.]